MAVLEEAVLRPEAQENPPRYDPAVRYEFPRMHSAKHRMKPVSKEQDTIERFLVMQRQLASPEEKSRLMKWKIIVLVLDATVLLGGRYEATLHHYSQKTIAHFYGEWIVVSTLVILVLAIVPQLRK